MTVDVELLFLNFLTKGLQIKQNKRSCQPARCPPYMKRELAPQQEGLVAESYKHTKSQV